MPLLRPLWWRAISGSFSSTTSGTAGSAARSARAVARPTSPPPTTTMGGALIRRASVAQRVGAPLLSSRVDAFLSRQQR